jgi:hypothetical protein
MNGDEALLRYDATVAAAAILGDKIVTSYFSGNAITSVLGGVDMTTTFAALDVTGNTGCNTFHGPYQVAGRDHDRTAGIDGSSLPHRAAPAARDGLSCRAAPCDDVPGDGEPPRPSPARRHDRCHIRTGVRASLT